MASTGSNRPRAANGRYVNQGEARARSRSVVHLALLSLAIVVAVVGFAFHLLWFAALILMSVLWGSLAEEHKRRFRASKGVIAEVVEAVVEQAKEVADAASVRPSPRQDEEEVSASGND